jgi:hypothetical protein
MPGVGRAGGSRIEADNAAAPFRGCRFVFVLSSGGNLGRDVWSKSTVSAQQPLRLMTLASRRRHPIGIHVQERTVRRAVRTAVLRCVVCSYLHQGGGPARCIPQNDRSGQCDPGLAEHALLHLVFQASYVEWVAETRALIPKERARMIAAPSIAFIGPRAGRQAEVAEEHRLTATTKPDARAHPVAPAPCVVSRRIMIWASGPILPSPGHVLIASSAPGCSTHQPPPD